MVIRPASSSQKKEFDRLAPHPLQSWAWGDFRKKMGQKVERFLVIKNQKIIGSFQVFFYRLPHLPYTIGYFPKGLAPTKEIVKTLKKIGKKHQAILIKMEPNITKEEFPHFPQQAKKLKLISGRPIFTRHTLVIDLTKSESELMANFHPKTRYNIRLAQRKGVKIIEDNSPQAFEKYWQLTEETTQRQRFYAHNKIYHRRMWQTMSKAGIAHLFLAQYKKETLAAWILFSFNGILYYPYGASSRRHREVMASNLMMWEAIRFGKKNHCQKFDLWGTPGPHPSPRDPWYGFHRFKMGYSPQLVEFVGTYDLVLKPLSYRFYQAADILRLHYLKIKKKLPSFKS